MNLARKIDEADEAKPVFLMLDWNDRLSWLVMPDYLERVKKFCPAYDPEIEPGMLAGVVANDFTQTQRRYCAAAVLRDGKIVGHVLSRLNANDAGARYLLVMQMEVDEDARIGNEARREFDDILGQWARAHGCQWAETFVADDKHARRVEMLYGYKRDRIRVRKDLRT